MWKFWPPRGVVLFFLLLPAGIQAQITDQDIFLQAEGLWAENRLEPALERYRVVVDRNPASPLAPTAAWKIALGEIRLSRPEKALASLNQALNRYPQLENAQTRFWKAFLQLELKDVDQGIRGLEALWDNAEEIGPDYFYHLARARGLSGRWEEAIQAMETFRKKKGPSYLDTPQPQLLLAQYYNRTGREDLVPALETRETWDEESQARLLWEKSLAHWQTGNKAAAVDLWTTLSRGRTALTMPAYIRLFQHLEGENKTRETEELVKGAEGNLATEPGLLAELKTRLGIMQYRAGQVQDALEVLKQAVGVPGNKAAGLGALYLITEYEKQSQWKPALDLAQQILVSGQEPRELLLERSAVLNLKAENWKEALEALSLLPPSGGSPSLLRTYFRAYALDRSGKSQEAWDLLEATPRPDTQNPLLKSWLVLQASLEEKLGKSQALEATQYRLMLLEPTNSRYRLGTASAAFKAGRMEEVISILDGWERAVPDLKKSDPSAWARNRYLRGMTALKQKSPGRALRSLEEIIALGEFSGKQEILPYVLYYAGWSALKMEGADPGKALGYLKQLQTSYPRNEFRVPGLYWAGWAAMSLKDWTGAESWFRLLEKEKLTPETAQAPLYLARSLAMQNRLDAAMTLFQNLGRASPPTDLSAPALLEGADLLRRSGKPEAALSTWQEVHDRFPGSPQGDEALALVVETAFSAGDWSRTVTAATRYRNFYPKGAWKDRVLHQTATAQLSQGQSFAAALAWTELMESYPRSPFRSGALFETGQIYFRSGDYAQAAELWNRLKQEDPGAAALYSLDRRLQEVRLIREGASPVEGQMKALVNKNTPEGRTAQVDLGRYYLLQGRPEEGRKLLEEVQLWGDPEASAGAQYWLAEYWFRQGQPKTAGEAFLKVISFRPQNRDLTASSLFRAVQMSLLNRNPAQARQILGAMTANFPDSDWLIKAREALEAYK